MTTPRYSLSFSSRKNAIAGSGIGESPASQRRTVRSSRSRISRAKRRADSPDASMARRSRSAWFIRLRLPSVLPAFPERLAHVVNVLLGNALVPPPHVIQVLRIAVGRFLNGADQLGFEFAGEVRKESGHKTLSGRAGLNCPDTTKYRAYAIVGQGGVRAGNRGLMLAAVREEGRAPAMREDNG